MKDLFEHKRKDVVFKTLFRKIRKFLQKDFNERTGFLRGKRFKPPQFYLGKVKMYVAESMDIDLREVSILKTVGCFLYPKDYERLGDDPEAESIMEKVSDVMYKYSHQKM